MTTLARRHVHQHPDLAGRPPANVVFCNGAGVDSMALLHLWCSNPESRDFPLDELLVITGIICSFKTVQRPEQDFCVVDMSSTWALPRSIPWCPR